MICRATAYSSAGVLAPPCYCLEASPCRVRELLHATWTGRSRDGRRRARVRGVARGLPSVCPAGRSSEGPSMARRSLFGTSPPLTFGNLPPLGVAAGAGIGKAGHAALTQTTKTLLHAAAGMHPGNGVYADGHNRWGDVVAGAWRRRRSLRKRSACTSLAAKGKKGARRAAADATDPRLQHGLQASGTTAAARRRGVPRRDNRSGRRTYSNTAPPCRASGPPNACASTVMHKHGVTVIVRDTSAVLLRPYTAGAAARSRNSLGGNMHAGPDTATQECPRQKV